MEKSAEIYVLSAGKRKATAIYPGGPALWRIGNLMQKRGFDPTARPLHILDLCTGSGCISLLLHALLAPHVKDLTIVGIDLSSRAIRLAQKNLEHNLRRGLLSSRARSEVLFRQADILGLQEIHCPKLEDVLSDQLLLGHLNGSGSSIPSSSLCWDVLISNPPYISPSSFKNGTTARSVRVYEPTLALVPPLSALSNLSRLNVGNIRQEDAFYPQLLSLTFRLGTRLAIFECGSLAQAQRVVCMAQTLARQVEHCRDFAIDIWQPCIQDDNDLSGARAVILRRVQL
ncbi:RNA methyltransferase [Rasamsonia emersonii CBS 393.64]|uniref:RNA methyltransferase n=1 Tax=Rasamsonia emersonii (strain ATCC 16479 / CBS 393.64 / IMI 116815) TaxID=1408163 RepID=A0A0F4YEJ2_RASE3|nr:RNA methyltransferase [Rasamsonia emersonii CBS 393.64]KKA16321.1 RNA methyltransferase [Rasamsonia emersonii CBS 393.64]